MGWFDGRSTTSHSHSHSNSNGGYFVRRRGSPTRSKSGGYSTYHTRNSAPSFFNLGRTSSGRSTGRSSGRSSPAHSVFSSFSSSSRRARPREGFIQRMIRSIKRLFRDIYRYARHHPIKVLMLVIVPLLTSGVLPKLLAMVGLRLPHGVISAFGGSGGGSGRGGFGEMAGGGGGKGMSENLTSLMNIAKMFA